MKRFKKGRCDHRFCFNGFEKKKIKMLTNGKEKEFLYTDDCSWFIEIMNKFNYFVRRY